ncbi:MAG TPA: hypothetical protein VKX49_26135 [Bryobacteraceae bacterium]|nr:hypothetical protein [Bryobacteraceae bacterium]
MNWEALHVVSTLLVAGAGLANYAILLAIKKEIAEAVGAVKEWARAEFVTQREADKRFEAMERQG